jgi:hypothetical protein
MSQSDYVFTSFGQKRRAYRDGEPCNHPGCLRHLSRPCDGCGRIGGRYMNEKPAESLVPHKESKP